MWSIAKALQIPLDKKIKELQQIPYTVAYVIRKRIQIDNFNELAKEKRPPDRMIWEGTVEEIDRWLDKVFKHNENPNAGVIITEDEIEK